MKKGKKQLIGKFSIIGILLLFSLNWGNNAMATTYRDNTLIVSGHFSGFELHQVSYQTTDFSVTTGQDPDNKIYHQLINDFTLDSMKARTTFSIGRKNSSEVANWFSKRVPKIRTTINESPRELNFAFIGTFTLTVSHEDEDWITDRTFVFEDIALAQGSNYFRNNWWFGGKNCVYLGLNTESAICKGYSGAMPVLGIFKLIKNVGAHIELKRIIII